MLGLYGSGSAGYMISVRSSGETSSEYEPCGLTVQMWRRQWAYLYMDCTARESLDTNFSVACDPSKQEPPFYHKRCNNFFSLNIQDPLI